MSQKSCCVPGCPVTIEDSVPLHRFPHPETDADKFKTWISIIGGEILTTLDPIFVYNNRRVCCRHFKDIYLYPKNRLCKLAIPVLHIPGAGNSNVSGVQTKNQTAVSGHSKNETAVRNHSKNETAVSNHSKNKTAVNDNSKNQTAVSDHGKNKTAVSDHSKNKTAVSDYRKNQLAVKDHGNNQTAVSNHSKNEAVLSDHSKNQAAVNINVEDAVDNSQYSAGFDTNTGVDDDCYNISDDECEAVVDDDSSFYHNVSKLPDDKDDMEGAPQNIDKNEELHDGFKCNYCSGEIKGYRYTCVQCPDYDLCGSCEARGAHCLHYVLRIPRPKPYTEIQPLLREIRLLLSGANTDVLWTPADEIKEEESNDEVDPLDIDCVTPSFSETEDNVPEITTRTSVKKSHENRQDNNDNVPQVTMQPRLTSRLHKASTNTNHKQTVTVDKRSAASTSSPYPASTRLISSNRNTLLTSPQAIDNTRTSGDSESDSESSQYTTSTRHATDGNTVFETSPQAIDNNIIPVPASSPKAELAKLVPKRNTLLTIVSSPQVLVNARTPASESSQYTVSTRLIADGNTVLTIESIPQLIDKTRTPVSESSLFTASTSVSSDSNTVLTIATNVEDTDSTSRSVPTASRLYASSSITAGGTETISNKIKITGDSYLQVPMATKRKCSDSIEASKPSQVVILKGSKKLIVMPSMSKVIGPGTRFKIIKKPSASGQPQAQGTVYAAGHRTRSTQREQDAPR